MITPKLQRLLELRSELEDLFNAVQFGIEHGKRNSVEQLKQIANRAIAIVEEWPEDYWPLENEQDPWPDQEPLINLLKIALANADVYRPSLDLNTEFTQWNAVSSIIFGALYYFRPTDDKDDSDEL